MGVVKEALLALPRVALMVPKLATDKRVPRRTKLALGGLAVYIASPWDLVPGFIPVLGQLDDAVALLLFVDGVLNQIDDAILLDHWTGDPATLRKLQWLARLTSRWVPARLRSLLFGKASDLRVLLHRELGRVEQDDDHVGRLGSLQRTQHRIGLDLHRDRALAADARRVGEDEAAVLVLDLAVDRIARRPARNKF